MFVDILLLNSKVADPPEEGAVTDWFSGEISE